VKAIRDEEPPIAIGRMITEAREKSGKMAIMKLHRLASRGRVTKKQVALEMTNLVELVHAVYGPGSSLAVLNKNYEVEEEFGRTPPKPRTPRKSKSRAPRKSKSPKPDESP
jgi:hypothetical protein